MPLLACMCIHHPLVLTDAYTEPMHPAAPLPAPVPFATHNSAQSHSAHMLNICHIIQCMHAFQGSHHRLAGHRLVSNCLRPTHVNTITITDMTLSLENHQLHPSCYASAQGWQATCLHNQEPFYIEILEIISVIQRQCCTVCL